MSDVTVIQQFEKLAEQNGVYPECILMERNSDGFDLSYRLVFYPASENEVCLMRVEGDRSGYMNTFIEYLDHEKHYQPLQLGFRDAHRSYWVFISLQYDQFRLVLDDLDKAENISQTGIILARWFK